jgi:hypothetical protein
VIYLKKFIENNRIPNLKHAGEPILGGSNISIFQQDWFEKLLPEKLTIKSIPKLKNLNFDQSLSDNKEEDKIYTLFKNDCTIDNDLVQFNYYQNTVKNPNDVNEDGEPDFLGFDIFFVKNENGLKLLVDITYGDTMVYEFSIETPNKINIIHYTGKGSLHDTETHFGFTKESIKDIVKFFNAFNHGIDITEEDLYFMDSIEDNYSHNKYDRKHLYNDESNLIEFGNSVKERRFIKKFENFSKNAC